MASPGALDDNIDSGTQLNPGYGWGPHLYGSVLLATQNSVSASLGHVPTKDRTNPSHFNLNFWRSFKHETAQESKTSTCNACLRCI